METPRFDALVSCVEKTMNTVQGPRVRVYFDLFCVALARCKRAVELSWSCKVLDNTPSGHGACYGAYLAAYGFLMICVDILQKLAGEGVITAQQMRDLTVCLLEANNEHLALAAELDAIERSS